MYVYIYMCVCIYIYYIYIVQNYITNAPTSWYNNKYQAIKMHGKNIKITGIAIFRNVENYTLTDAASHIM